MEKRLFEYVAKASNLWGRCRLGAFATNGDSIIKCRRNADIANFLKPHGMATKDLKQITTISIFFMCCFFTSAHALTDPVDKYKHPFYVGLAGGYGNTTWQGLIPPTHKQNIAMSMSTPKYVNEGGGAWGLFGGYEFSPFFALETTYTHYHDAIVTFDQDSIFSFERDGLTTFRTATETVSVMGKLMMFFPRSDIRAYSSLGIAELHRQDSINAHWIGTPTFGAGINYNFTSHVMGEVGAVYTAGKGQSELNPVDDYFPFLYGVFLRLGYRF